MTTKIEWTDATWNPLASCTVYSPGCKRCYAMRLAARLERMGSAKYAGLTEPSKAGAVWTGEVRLDDAALLQPLRWKKPRRIFVNSMSDLFHEGVPDEWIDKVFAIMALAQQHTFQILTKRAVRMRAYLSDPGMQDRVVSQMQTMFGPGWPKWLYEEIRDFAENGAFPADNVWLGVSVEDQQRADERIPDLLASPAAVRFLSCEPLIGPVDLSSIDISGDEEVVPLGAKWLDRLENGEIELARIDWVIAGGESGPGARLMHPDWARSLRDQCAQADVPFFFKQWGEHIPIYESEGERGQLTFDAADGGPEGRFEGRRAKVEWFGKDAGPNEDGMARVGKKRVGRLLDGVEHNGFPEVRHGRL